MNESKENDVGIEKPMSENIWGWRWSWISLGIIVVGGLFMIFVGPNKADNSLDYGYDPIDSVKVAPKNEN